MEISIRLPTYSYDVTNIAHGLRGPQNVLVIGAGGERDILSSLQAKERSVTAIEINNNIIDAVTNRFGEFTGHIDRYKNVRFINDEARSWIARSKDTFGMIQLSLIDTWAATASGAFALSENALYTEEAWQLFIDHLSDSGILSLSRWYYSKLPAEIYRMATLASKTLLDRGISDPAMHVIVIKPISQEETVGATMLLSKSPFTPNEVEALQRTCIERHFEVLAAPHINSDPSFARYLSSTNTAAI
jgi:hypothetical protein